MSRRPACAGSWLALGLLAAAAVGLTGCLELLGVLSEPEPVVKARFKLTKSPLLVVIDESNDGRSDASIRNNVMRELSEQLVKHEVNRQIVPDEQVRRMQKTNPAAAGWSLGELGKAMHAEQVLHVQLEPYASTPEAMDPTARAKLTARVRVIDVAEDDQLWPKEQAGLEVEFELRANDAQLDRPESELKKALAQGLADRIARLFYKHKPTRGQSFQEGARKGTVQ